MQAGGFLSRALLGSGFLAVALSTRLAFAFCEEEATQCVVSDNSLDGVKESDDPLGSGIDTGYWPTCETPNSEGFCIGDNANPEQNVQVRANLVFESAGNKPVYAVGLGDDARLALAWGSGDDFEISLQPATSDSGFVEVLHTIAPSLGLFLNIPVIGEFDFEFDASELVTLIPQNSWNYVATSEAAFNPFGFAGTSMRVEGGPIANSLLFEVGFDQLVGLVTEPGVLDDITSGAFAFSATSELDFTYATTEVAVVGSEGPITAEDGSTTLPIVGGPFIELDVNVRGTLTYAGKLEFRPVVRIESIAGTDFQFDIPIDVGLDPEIPETTIDLLIPSQILHFPLPDVFISEEPLNLGDVEVGVRETFTFDIENDGEFPATARLTSDNAKFQFDPRSLTVAPDTIEAIELSFRPTATGEQTGTVTVTTNDPDQPVFKFPVIANGVPSSQTGTGGSGGQGTAGASTGGNGGEEAGGEPGSGARGGSDMGSSGAGGDSSSGTGNASDDSGCGCRAATPARPLGAGIGLGLVALAFLRRRRAWA